LKDAVVRDETLVPGPTAGQWNLRGGIVIVLAVFALLVCFLVAVGQEPHQRASIAVLGAILCGAGLAIGGVFVWIGARKSALERLNGYSTMNDVPGLELRHPRTGALVRARDVPIEKRSTRRVYDGIVFTKDKSQD
jgi:hypothetical protein